MNPVTDFLLALAALCVALALRPWRALPAGGPPWPWLGATLLLPLLWSADRLVRVELVQPLSGAALLMLMAGWPLAVLAMLPVAALLAALGLDADTVLHRLVWLGIAPATGAMLLGGAVRRWLPRHPIVYILGRGFFATAIAGTAAGVTAAWLEGGAPTLRGGELMLARGLAAWGDATLTGMLTAIFVAYRPQWLATWSDRIWLPSR